MIVRLKGADTLIEAWTGPTGRCGGARYTEEVRYAARAGEAAPIELVGGEQGQFRVADLVGKTEDKGPRT
jgi:hypothetical protein